MSVPSRDCSLDYNFEWKTTNSRLVLNVCGRENKRYLLYVLSKLFIFGLSDLLSRWLNNFQAPHRRLNPLCLQVCTYRYSIPPSTLALTVRCFSRPLSCTQGTSMSWLPGYRRLPWVFCVTDWWNCLPHRKAKYFSLKFDACYLLWYMNYGSPRCNACIALSS